MLVRRCCCLLVSWLWSAERRASQQAALVSVRVGESLQNIEKDALHKNGQRRQTHWLLHSIRKTLRHWSAIPLKMFC